MATLMASEASNALYRTARRDRGPACYRPGRGEPVGPWDHPADRAPGYLLRLPSGRIVWTGATGVIRPVDLSAAV